MAFDSGRRVEQSPVRQGEVGVGVMGTGAGVLGVFFFFGFAITTTVLGAGGFSELVESFSADSQEIHIDKDQLSNAVALLLLAASGGVLLNMLRTLSKPGV